MSELNLAKAQALVVAWRFLLPSYSSHLSRHHTGRDLLAASYSLSSSSLVPSLTSYSSLCIVQLPSICVTLRAALTLSQSSPPAPSLTSYSVHLTHFHTRRFLLAIVLAAGTLIDIVLLTVYCTTSWCLCHSDSCTNHVTKLAT